MVRLYGVVGHACSGELVDFTSNPSNIRQSLKVMMRGTGNENVALLQSKQCQEGGKPDESEKEKGEV